MRHERAQDHATGEARSWATAWRLAAYSALLLVLLFVLQGGVALVDPETIGALTVWSAGAACVAALVATWVMMSGVESRPPASVGLALSLRALRDFASGLGLGLVLIGGVMLVLAAAGWLARVDSAPLRIAAPGSLLYVTALLVLAAFFEEVAVRGYPLQVLARTRGPGVAIGATAAVFAALHGVNPGVGWTAIANTLLAGILLGLLYWKTLSLWFVTGAHFAWNWTMGVAAGLPVSGLNVDSPLVRVSEDGPDLWTGGAYGPEGGLILTLATVTAIVWTARTPRLSRDPAVLALGPMTELQVTRTVSADAREAGRPDIRRSGSEEA